ncbi:MAG TPA: MarR family transcriptional regulator [Streptosporangiaceae bacterium]
MSASEARALFELVAARGIAQGELAGLLGLEKSTVSRLAAGLERKGWVRRGRDEGNQRYVRLYLTPEGTAVAGRLWRAVQSRQARLLGSLSAEERRGLAAGLRGLVRGLAAEGLSGDASAAAGPGPAAGRAEAAAPAADPADPPEVTEQAGLTDEPELMEGRELTERPGLTDESDPAGSAPRR